MLGHVTGDQIELLLGRQLAILETYLGSAILDRAERMLCVTERSEEFILLAEVVLVVGTIGRVLVIELRWQDL